MDGYRGSVKTLTGLLALSGLVACGADDTQMPPPATLEESMQEVCELAPNLPGCGSAREPRPGFAKFTVGRADAVRWVGQDGCKRIDVMTGRQSGTTLIKAAGEVHSSCNPTDVHFSFMYRQHSDTLAADAWTSAFQPLDIGAARRLLDSCSPDSRPDPSVVMGSWWKANNTYAENLLLDYTSPLAYASRLIPFDDDGFERLDDDVLNGEPVATFRNDHATVWMAKEERDRPLRVANEQNRDILLSEWNNSFAADIPADLRELNEVCSVAR